MNVMPSHLQEHERVAIWAFWRQLSEYLGNDLHGLWLFGSKARGDFTPDSDVDVLVVLDHLTSEKRGKIRRLAARLSLDNDTLLNTHIYEKTHWDVIVAHQDLLWREIKRDGIQLHVMAVRPIP